MQGGGFTWKSLKYVTFMIYIVVACPDICKHYGIIKCDNLQYLVNFFETYKEY